MFAFEEQTTKTIELRVAYISSVGLLLSQSKIPSTIQSRGGKQWERASRMRFPDCANIINFSSSPSLPISLSLSHVLPATAPSLKRRHVAILFLVST